MRALLLAGTVALALGTAGCGSSDGPPTPVASALRTVDQALRARDYAAAQSALRELVTATKQAQSDGHLQAAEGQRVIAAVTVLTRALPAPAAVPASPTPTPGRTVAPPHWPHEKHKAKGEHHDEGGD